MPALGAGAMVHVGSVVVPFPASLASDFWEVAPGRSPPPPLLLVGAGHYPSINSNAQLKRAVLPYLLRQAGKKSSLVRCPPTSANASCTAPP